MPKCFAVWAVVLAAVFSLPATSRADVWTWTFAGGSYSGSGTFVTDSTLSTGFGGFSGYKITSITGTWTQSPGSAQTISGLLPVPSSGFDNDNLVSMSNQQLSWGGFLFGVNSAKINIYYSSGYRMYDGVNVDIAGTFSAVNTVPEPSTWALMGLGAAAVLWQLRRRIA